MDMTKGAHIGAHHLMCGACGGGLMVNPNAYMSGHHHAMMQFKRSEKGRTMNDELNRCPIDQCRTLLIEVKTDHTIEECSHCSKIFQFFLEGAHDE